MMHVPTLMFPRLKGHKVHVICQSFSTAAKNNYEGVVIGDMNTGFDMFIELDTGDLINVKYIEAIQIME